MQAAPSEREEALNASAAEREERQRENRRAAMAAAIREALVASAKGDTGYVSHLQSCEETDDDGEPTGRAFTLVDGYFDLLQVAGILMKRA